MVALASTLLAFASRFRGAPARGRRAYAFAIPLGFLLLVGALLAGCGSSSTSQQNLGTPKGNDVLTITGTSNGLSHAQTLTLTVELIRNGPILPHHPAAPDRGRSREPGFARVYYNEKPRKLRWPAESW
jgi:hypothetical protein